MAGETVYSEMWRAYRGIILHSIVTTFGLDFLVHDQEGGDVDTIYGVRESKQYKNPLNAIDYNNRGEYDRVAYHNNDAYNSLIRDARNSQAFFKDSYVPGNTIYYGKASGLGTYRKANLDHVIAAHEIHEDPGRILAGIDGVKLANDNSNLQFTNEHLNKSMGDMSIDDYIKWCKDNGEPLYEDVIAQMREKDAYARKIYEQSIREAYYSSERSRN